ncbi:MAG: CRISPR-associated endonuclease Cas2 [Clostridia bacterium]|jgi:CRISPR-associated protein Cas2|nr:CRISPR-associated endonuclease Cas2 [Clostridia bacterium]
MRVVVFFDLPVQTCEERRNYSRFRRMLVKNGFLMLQESVYCRMALNQNVSASISQVIRKNKPMKGLVQILVVTEKQFSKMEYVTGEFLTDVISDDRRVVIL